jgi:hypothetical protein
MNCKKCEVRRVHKDENGNDVVDYVQGRVFVDRIFSERKHVELFCINCGARWMLDKTKNVFAAWLVSVEEAHANAVTVR